MEVQGGEQEGEGQEQVVKNTKGNRSLLALLIDFCLKGEDES